MYSCIACDISCKNCTINSTNCDVCNTGFSKKTSDSTCVSACPTGFYSDGTNCVACDPACATCYGNLKTQCYSCKYNGSANYFKEIGVDTCLTTCGSGEFENTTTFTCQLCDFRCTECGTTGTNCSSCSIIAGTNYYRLGEDCLAVCPYTGYFSKNGTKTC